MKLKCNILLEDKIELQSKLDIATKEINSYKILFSKSRELEDKKKDDTAKVCSYNTIC